MLANTALIMMELWQLHVVFLVIRGVSWKSDDNEKAFAII
jgi:hypothetical protein